LYEKFGLRKCLRWLFTKEPILKWKN
jgi:hypothetical protein